MAEPIIETLLTHEEPSIRWRTRTEVLGEKLDAKTRKRAEQEITRSDRVLRLLSERNSQGKIPGNAYSKWSGAHWVLVALAELGHPKGDRNLFPLREQVLDFISALPIVSIRERAREHASIPGNALFAFHTLGIADDRVEQLVERLLSTQWPDGGWNCDRDRHAHCSSFAESLIPLRALGLHARLTKDRRVTAAVARGTEFFLERGLFRRKSNGRVISRRFLELHYPCYWHYDILFALKVIAELGAIRDPRCAEAITVLEEKRLADGGFPAEGKFYGPSGAKGRRSLVQWGGVKAKRSNPWVTIEALAVLRAARRPSRGALRTARR